MTASTCSVYPSFIVLILFFIFSITTNSNSPKSREFCKINHILCYETAVNSIESITRQRLDNITHERNNYRSYLTGKREKIAVITIHGNFEAPRSIDSISKFFHKEFNANVFSVLLPGYWETPMTNLDDISYREWTREVDRAVSIATLLGENVIVFGHSLGGLLGIYSAFEYPESITMLFASAPAIKQAHRAEFAGILGTILGLSGNDYFKLNDDNGYNTPYLSPKTSFYIKSLYKFMKYRFSSDNAPNSFDFSKYKTPTMFIVSESDDVISTEAALKFFNKLKVNKEIIVYKDMDHHAINKGKGEYIIHNDKLDVLLKEIRIFTNENLTK